MIPLTLHDLMLVGHNDISDDGALAIAEVLKQPEQHLRELRLRNHHVILDLIC
jgi:hypothetical protein